MIIFAVLMGIAGAIGVAAIVASGKEEERRWNNNVKFMANIARLKDKRKEEGA